jgi:putative addiction module component (TIGR02574 family)
MTSELKLLAKTVIQLPSKDRAFLAEQLLGSLEEDVVEQAWIEEAKRRCSEVRSGKVKPIPAADVYRRIEKMLAK